MSGTMIDGKPRRLRQQPRGVESTWMRGGLVAKRTCSVDGCERASKARGYCDAHYARWSRTGTTGAAEIADPGVSAPCSVEGCERKRKARGYCQQHYFRWQKYGEPGPAEIRVNYDPRVRDDQGRKRCSRCAKWQSVAEFYKDSKSSDGLIGHCIRCLRSDKLRVTYGVTIDWYEKKLSDQGGVCALCSGVNASGKLLAVDHDHSCCPGRKSCGSCARALLCLKCNTGLGAFGDDVDLLLAAIEYVRTHKGGS